MKMMRVVGMTGAVLAATALSGSNAFAEGASAPAASPPAAEIAASADLWKPGAQAIPFLGMNSIAGDAGKGTGVGFRFGSLFGGRFAQNWSVNGEVVLDVLNTASTPGLDTSGWNGDFAVAPLYHYPLAKVELIAGPLVGTSFQLGRLKTSQMSETTWGYGWTIGANVGAFVPLHDRKSLGVLFNLILHEPLKACADAGMEMCKTSGLQSATMIGISLAALL
jgi:hypothetical protein